jgi:hypothetical protein
VDADLLPLLEAVSPAVLAEVGACVGLLSPAALAGAEPFVVLVAAHSCNSYPYRFPCPYPCLWP